MSNITARNENAVSNVLDFYFLAIRLKELIRTGWKHWNVDKERLESVAEHVYGVSMLAIAMNSEFAYQINIEKVIMMIALHELEEIEITDITPFQGVSVEEKKLIGHMAIRKILSPLLKGDMYIELIEEFDERKTNEARFAYQCDKLEADLMAFKYDNETETRYENANSVLKENKELQALSEKGLVTMSQFFSAYDISKYDDNFRCIIESIMNR